MRFSRDRRGYENTFVLHGERRRGKGHARLIYWFRTPPEVKVGRAALDEEAIRLIEELNPDIDFDWTRILKGEPQEERPRPKPQQKVRHVVRTRAAELPKAFAAAAPPQEEPVSAPPITSAHASLGGEVIARLRARYAEVLARLSERVTDESRREELKTLAGRLNPDNWVTDDEVKTGLEEYEGVFAEVRSAVGIRRRRRRRRGRSGSPGEGADAAARPDGAVDVEPTPDLEHAEADTDAEDV